MTTLFWLGINNKISSFNKDLFKNDAADQCVTPSEPTSLGAPAAAKSAVKKAFTYCTGVLWQLINVCKVHWSWKLLDTMLNINYHNYSVALKLSSCSHCKPLSLNKEKSSQHPAEVTTCTKRHPLAPYSCSTACQSNHTHMGTVYWTCHWLQPPSQLVHIKHPTQLLSVCCCKPLLWRSLEAGLKAACAYGPTPGMAASTWGQLAISFTQANWESSSTFIDTNYIALNPVEIALRQCFTAPSPFTFVTYCSLKYNKRNTTI